MSEDTKTAVTHGVTVEAPAAMPEVEPGHKGDELNPGGVYDPNAARRHAEGRGPGLQDSEIMQPAHWQQNDPEAPAATQSRLDALEREREGYKARGDSKRVQEVDAEIKRVKAALSKDEQPTASSQG